MNPVTTISVKDKCCKPTYSLCLFGFGWLFTVPTNKVVARSNRTTIASETQKIEVNTADFAAGIYVVQIQAADFIETKKLVIEK